MIKKIIISEKDNESVLGHSCPKDLSLKEVNFQGLVVNKPWGYEYLMFQTPDVSIWMLYIKKGYSTSTHCHPNKKTSLLLISGEAVCSTLNDKFNLKDKEGLIFDKGVFHSTEALSENGIFVMEVETPSDKTDLFRLKDKYNRENKAYTEKKNITNKLYNYYYLYLNENNKNSTDILEKYKFVVRTFKNYLDFSKKIREIDMDVGIILAGKIKTENRIIEIGDIFEKNELKNAEMNFPIKILAINERKNLVKLSDYVISFLEKKGIKDVFLVSGGNLMHLLESIRVNKNMNYICNHHEQASAMAAEGYSKMSGKTGFAMVTSGPGGTNAITGVAGAWIDSNPMIIISGQSYSSQTVGKSGLRQLGVQEINIVDIVRPITKYAIMVKDPKKIKYQLEKALHIANSGRPGPVWVDIPVNMQMAMIEEKDLESFVPEEFKKEDSDLKEKVKEAIALIKDSKRPVIILGNGVRLSHAEKEFFELAEKLSIPIVTTRNANDLIWEEHPLYAGRIGSFGQRASNLAIQNSDLVLSIGSRVALAVTGWAYKDFAREAKKIIVDIDSAELKKIIINADIAIKADAKDFIYEMSRQLDSSKLENCDEWKSKIKEWRAKYPVCLPEYEDIKGSINTYYFSELLSQELNNDDIVVTDMGMSFQCIMQGLKLKKGQRLFTSAGLAAMGFGLPGAIGACIGNGRKRTICVSGDGGLMMNIQELQTVFHNKLPIKLFVFNNKGYSSIRETQKAYFEGYLGSEKGSGVSIPDIVKVAESFGIKAKRIENQEKLREEIKEVLDYNGPYVCDLNISENQQVIPKQGAFHRPDGKPVPRPIEDMIPYVDREEFKKDMIIEPVPFDPYKE